MLTLSLSRVSTCILCSWDFVAARCTASRTYVRHLPSVMVVVGWLFGLVVVVVKLLFYIKKNGMVMVWYVLVLALLVEQVRRGCN